MDTFPKEPYQDNIHKVQIDPITHWISDLISLNIKHMITKTTRVPDTEELINSHLDTTDIWDISCPIRDDAPKALQPTINSITPPSIWCI